MKILVVDDDSMITDMLDSLLTDWGYEPMVFNRGVEALAALAQDDNIRLAILDCNIPIISGLHICKTIRKKSEDHVYVIMLTSNGHIKHVREAVAAGVNNYIVKPFEPDDLKAKLEAGIRAIGLEPSNSQQSRAA